MNTRMQSATAIPALPMTAMVGRHGTIMSRSDAVSGTAIFPRSPVKL